MCISYPLQVRLVDYKSKNEPQIYEYNLTVLEPPRVRLHSLSASKTVNPRCCCSDLGVTTLSVDYEKNVIQSGDTLNLNIAVDNSRCETDFKKVNIKLFSHLFAESNSGVARTWTTELSAASTQSVPAGKQNNMPLSLQIPTIVNPTAIGTILANYYTVDVNGELAGCGCCGDDDPNITAHIIITTPTPQIIKKPEVIAPAGFNPMVAPLVVCASSKPFVYTPNPKLQTIGNRAEYP